MCSLCNKRTPAPLAIYYVLFTTFTLAEENLTAQLKDIKPLLTIPDSSFYLYWGLIGLGGTLGVAILFFMLKRLWENRKINKAKQYLAALKAIDWNNSKKAAYEATHYARLLATDERRKELFSQLEPMLEKYKYRRVVDDVDQETLNKFNLYVQVADESI